MFRGCSFSVRLPHDSPLVTAAIEAIEQHGGCALAADIPLSRATHVIVQHQQQPACAEAAQQQKEVVTCYWLLACAETQTVLPCTHPLHKPFPGSAIQGATAYGVSITAFQGMQRQILLDMLRCMGVDVQKQMRLGSATHIIAQDVDERISNKLQHVRKPEWADKISIVNCKWVYDCIGSWQVLPTGVCPFAVPDAYKQNCSDTEAMAWQGDSFSKQSALPSASKAMVTAVPLHSTVKGPHAGSAAQLAGQTRGAKQLPFQHLVASCVQPFCSPAVAGGAQRDQAPKSGWKNSRTARTVPTPAGLGAGLTTSKQTPGSPALQSSLPQSAAAAAAAAAPPPPPPPDDMGDEQPGRESLGGTQGAITGLTHMALQKHNDALAAASTGGPVESQGLGMQVADAEAATARLVAQMTESSPNQDDPKSWPLQLVTGQEAGDGRPAHNTAAGQQQQPHQQHSSDRENVPQQRPGKRGSNAQSEHDVPAADPVAACTKKLAKRRKVSSATAVDATAAQRAAGGTSVGLPPDVKDIVGRTVQQHFQEGVFKGVVKSYTKKHKWFRVEYEDGDRSVSALVALCLDACRQELTWKELQPILLPVSLKPHVEPGSKAPAKRKLHPPDTHLRGLQPKPAAQQAAATDAVLHVGPVQSADTARKSAKPTHAGRKSAKTGRAEEDEQAVLAEEPIRADTPAGPGADAGNCPGPKAAASVTPCSGSKKARVMIALGSMHSREQQAYSIKLAKIGVACVSHTQCPRWKPGITHVVLPSLVRSVKSLAGMAAGRWVLHADFIEASASAEALVDPEEYELDNGTALVSPHAPRHWRQRHEVHGTGAFHQLHVLIYGACDRPGPSKDDIALIVQVWSLLIILLF
ncbi:hypothetical protein ABBQ38_004164 [Trebouxia sp. C0009 RCD-2024]